MNLRSALMRLLGVVVVVGIGVGVLIWRQNVPGVDAAFTPLPSYVGYQTQLNLHLKAERGGVTKASVSVVQGDQRFAVLEQDFSDSVQTDRTLEFVLAGKELGLHEGDARLEVYASDGFWRMKPVDGEPLISVPVFIDFTPPTLAVLAFTRYPAQGGTAIAVIQCRDADRIEVVVGEDSHATLPAGQEGSGKRVALFAIGPDHPQDQKPVAIARDGAGNESRQTIDTVISPRKFERGSVTLKSEFLARKLPELLPGEGEWTPDRFAEGFVKVNRDMRAQAAITKVQLSTKTDPLPLWKGKFVHPTNARVFSNFAETRDYTYEGKSLDTQMHMGFDLASLKHAAVPAANGGRVVFAGPLGIYGNTVVLDHGWGLQTLYAHMSVIDVKMDDMVEKGATIGRSGTTGLAVGDHIHYEVLVHGQPVNPLQWWDGRWIEDHILAPLADAEIRTASAGVPAN